MGDVGAVMLQCVVVACVALLCNVCVVGGMLWCGRGAVVAVLLRRCCGIGVALLTICDVVVVVLSALRCCCVDVALLLRCCCVVVVSAGRYCCGGVASMTCCSGVVAVLMRC